ncbi:uncharacterized protein LOC132549362 [Ylistrum balloti]|uniref:uncharacterized protein LOC132549362 n=1 Tax=Ylistrum balloti TaxID=509963 RepID=UPI002905A7D7|nr:uncharacterized protein LOC132549362 [Ylistrum balloti]
MVGDKNTSIIGNASPPLQVGRNEDPTKIMKTTMLIWEQQTKDIFITKGLQNVQNASKNNNLVIITGPQGSGKSTALRYAAMSLKQEGFVVYPCNKISEIIYYWDDTRKQVFIIDDPIGRECVSLVGVQKLEKYDQSIKHCITSHTEPTTKLILAVRSEIINDKYVSSSNTLLSSQHHVIDLTDEDNALSEQERKDMLAHYLSKSGRNEEVALQMPNLHCFPLLCHAFCKVGTIRKNAAEFFSSPFSVIKDTFVRIRERNPPHFCVLALCAVYSNDFSIRDLHDESPKREKVSRIMDILGINREKELRKLVNALDALNGVYLLKNDNSYSFLHSLFQDTVTFILGEESTEILLTYCSSTFLRSHVKISQKNNGEHVIILEHADYPNLAVRMCQELRKHNVEDIFSHTALANKQFLKIFMEECSKDKIIEYANGEKIALLAWSCHVRLFRLTRALLENGADLNICDESERSALMWLCRNNRSPQDQIRNITKVLLEAGAAVNLIDKRDQTAIMYAISKGDVKIVQNLIEYGASVREVSTSLSPLSLAVKCSMKHTRRQHASAKYWNSLEQQIELLLKKGADPNFKPDGEKTLLYQAVSCSNTAVCKCLLDHGADIEQSDLFHEDLLCCAISNCSTELVNLLLERNVSVNIANYFSKSPLHLAVSQNDCELVKQLLKMGACVNARDLEGETPLHLSVKAKRKEITEMLLQEGADVMAEDKRGQTPQLWNIKTYNT